MGDLPAFSAVAIHIQGHCFYFVLLEGAERTFIKLPEEMFCK